MAPSSLAGFMVVLEAYIHRLHASMYVSSPRACFSREQKSLIICPPYATWNVAFVRAIFWMNTTVVHRRHPAGQKSLMKNAPMTCIYELQR
jgi:hypothetical protein